LKGRIRRQNKKIENMLTVEKMKNGGTINKTLKTDGDDKKSDGGAIKKSQIENQEFFEDFSAAEKLIEIESHPFFTGRTKDDDGNLLREKVQVSYVLKWDSPSNQGNPNVEQYSSLFEAYKWAQEPGDFYNAWDGHFNEILLYVQSIWVDADGDEIEEDDPQPFTDLKQDDPIRMILGNVQIDQDEPAIYRRDFAAREQSADELLTHVIRNIQNDIIKEIDVDNQKLKIVVPKVSKYTSISIRNEQDETIDTIELRIADHTYNPSNNQSGINFISVEIANVNPTEGRWNTRYSIGFNGSSNYQDVVDAVNDRIIEIVEDVKLPQKVKKAKRGAYIKKSKQDFSAFNLRNDHKKDVFTVIDKLMDQDENFCIVRPEICQGTLDIDRANMPQIYDEHMDDYVDFLESRGINSRVEHGVEVGTLKPTQMDISLPRMKRMLTRLLEGYYTDDQGKAMNPMKRRVVATEDGYLLDGHHRWATSLFLSPNNTVDVVRIDAPIDQLVEVSKEFGKAEFQKFMFGGRITTTEPTMWSTNTIGNYVNMLGAAITPVSFYDTLSKEVEYSETGIEVTISNALLKEIGSELVPDSPINEFNAKLEIMKPIFQATYDDSIKGWKALSKTGKIMGEASNLLLIQRNKKDKTTTFKFIPGRSPEVLEDQNFLDVFLDAISVFLKQKDNFGNPTIKPKLAAKTVSKITFGAPPSGMRSKPAAAHNLVAAYPFTIWDDEKDKIAFREYGYEVVVPILMVLTSFINSVESAKAVTYLLRDYGVLDLRREVFLTDELKYWKRWTKLAESREVDEFIILKSAHAVSFKLVLSAEHEDLLRNDELWKSFLVAINRAYINRDDLIDTTIENPITKLYSALNAANSTVSQPTHTPVSSPPPASSSAPVGALHSAVMPPTLNAPASTDVYRFKTAEEFTKEFGKDWQMKTKTFWPSPEADYLLGAEIDAGMYNRLKENPISVWNYELKPSHDASAEKKFNVSFDMVTAGQPVVSQSAAPNSKQPVKLIKPPKVYSGVEEIEEQIKGIELLLTAFGEDEYAVRTKLLKELDQLRKAKEKIIKGQYFTPDLRNLMELYASKISSAQRNAVPIKGCGLSTPSGQPSELDVIQYEIVRSPEFKTWFGDWEAAYISGNYGGVSKAINPRTGEPLLLYHGKENMRIEATFFGFAVFPVKYFGTNYSYSKYFTEYGKVKVLYEMFVRVLNPINLSAIGLSLISPQEFVDVVFALYGYKIQTRLVETDPVPLWRIIRANPKMLVEIRDKAGFDGFIIYEDNPHDIVNGQVNTTLDYITFSNNQSKAADGRNTTFFIESEDFRFRDGGVINA
jgi:hypothetical protein